MRRPRLQLMTAALVVTLLAVPSSAAAYSVFAHEGLVDAAWQDRIAPLLKQRFPHASVSELDAARAYAYGGSLIQDFGYYPFGSRFFSNLVHYVRSGDFVEALICESPSLNEYAFALGAVAHHASDDVGHPGAVNRAVPIIYPKERGAFKSDVYKNLIGFEVATPVLERAFRDTYGLELRDVFGNTDLAIGTYRYAVSKMIPDMTRLAWRTRATRSSPRH